MMAATMHRIRIAGFGPPERLTLEEIFLSNVHHAKANLSKEAGL